jgi:hypothetical protein
MMNLKDIAWKFAYLILQAVGVVFFVSIISSTFVRILFHYIVPKNAIREILHFDFRLDHPKASLRLGAIENQWEYLKPLEKQSIFHSKQYKRYLSAGSKYDISLLSTFSKTPRNSEIGKVVVSMTMLDGSGEAIAQSIRTIPLLYQSTTIKLLEEFLTFSFGLRIHPWLSTTPMSTIIQPPISIQSVQTIFMEHFQEPKSSSGLPPSERIVIELSTPDVDLEYMELVLSPRMGYLA